MIHVSYPRHIGQGFDYVLTTLSKKTRALREPDDRGRYGMSVVEAWSERSKVCNKGEDAVKH